MVLGMDKKLLDKLRSNAQQKTPVLNNKTGVSIEK